MENDGAIYENVCHFIRKHGETKYSLPLILFFARHPEARFNELAIIYALDQDVGRPHIRKALRGLVDEGIVKIKMEDDVALYNLSEEAALRCLVSAFASLDVSQQQYMANQDRLRSPGKQSNSPTVPSPAVLVTGTGAAPLLGKPAARDLFAPAMHAPSPA